MKLTSKQLMEKYDRTRVTIYNWIDRGMPCEKVQIGLKEVYEFDSEEVDKWLKGDK